MTPDPADLPIASILIGLGMFLVLGFIFWSLCRACFRDPKPGFDKLDIDLLEQWEREKRRHER